jgi:hypothetical protein
VRTKTHSSWSSRPATAPRCDQAAGRRGDRRAHAADHRDEITRARMKTIGDPDFKRRTPGSTTLVRAAPATRIWPSPSREAASEPDRAGDSSLRLRRSENDDRAARPPHPSLRHCRNRQQKLALQESRLTRDDLSSPEPRSPRLRNPTSYAGPSAATSIRHRPRGPFCTPIRGFRLRAD